MSRRRAVARFGLGFLAGGIAMGIIASSAGWLESASSDDESGSNVSAGIDPAEVGRPILRVGVSGARSLDPARAREESVSEMLVADLLYDGLTSLDPATGAVEGALAESWESTEGGMVWVFRLDADRAFSSGAPVSSSDVAASIERVRELGSAVLASTGLSAIEAYDTTDPRTLVIRLSSPYEELPALLAGPVFGVVPAGVDEATMNGAATPVVSGPYALGGASEESWLLARRPEIEWSGVDLLALRRFGSSDDAFDALVTGEVELVAVPLAREAEVPGEVGLVEATGPSQVFFGLDLRNPELADVRLREAVIRAVDSSAVVDTALPGAATATSSLGTPLQCVAPCGADVARASALVAELAAERGGAVPITIDTFGPATEGSAIVGGLDESVLAHAVADQLRAVGFLVEVIEHDPADYATAVGTGTLSLFRWGWVSPLPGPGGSVPWLLTSESPDNVFGLVSPSVDAAAAAAVGASDPVIRAQAYADAVEAADPSFYIIPVGIVHRVVAQRPEASGVEWDAAGRLRLDAVAFG